MFYSLLVYLWTWQAHHKLAGDNPSVPQETLPCLIALFYPVATTWTPWINCNLLPTPCPLPVGGGRRGRLRILPGLATSTIMFHNKSSPNLDACNNKHAFSCSYVSNMGGNQWGCELFWFRLFLIRCYKKIEVRRELIGLQSEFWGNLDSSELHSRIKLNELIVWMHFIKSIEKLNWCPVHPLSRTKIFLERLRRAQIFIIEPEGEHMSKRIVIVASGTWSQISCCTDKSVTSLDKKTRRQVSKRTWLPAYSTGGKQTEKKAQQPERTYFPMISWEIAEKDEGKGRLLRGLDHKSCSTMDRELSWGSRTRA